MGWMIGGGLTVLVVAVVYAALVLGVACSDDDGGFV
jgi:hypothetical protein